MYSQGEVIKTWRRRWFILKQGFLFRFADQSVDHASKPRGIVDLTNVQDVSDGRDATGKANSIKLSTATGQVRIAAGFPCARACSRVRCPRQLCCLLPVLGAGYLLVDSTTHAAAVLELPSTGM